MIRLDVVVTDREQRERAVGRELWVPPSDLGPRCLYRAALGEIDLDPLSAGCFTVPGKEPDADPQAQNLWD